MRMLAVCAILALTSMVSAAHRAQPPPKGELLGKWNIVYVKDTTQTGGDLEFTSHVEGKVEGKVDFLGREGTFKGTVKDGLMDILIKTKDKPDLTVNVAFNRDAGGKLQSPGNGWWSDGKKKRLFNLADDSRKPTIPTTQRLAPEELRKKLPELTFTLDMDGKVIGQVRFTKQSGVSVEGKLLYEEREIPISGALQGTITAFTWRGEENNPRTIATFYKLGNGKWGAIGHHNDGTGSQERNLVILTEK